MDARKKVTELAERAGITINGSDPWDIQVHETDFYNRIVRETSLGLGNSYMDGWWDCGDITEMIARLLRADLSGMIMRNPALLATALISRITNRQTVHRARQVGEQHYDIGPELYEPMLGSTMAYSCGLWYPGAKTLDEAQEAKLELSCRKLELASGMRLLDIGCGWGSLVNYATPYFDVQSDGVTISASQAAYAQNHAHAGVTIRDMDYRRVTGKYDRIASIGMFEHVGYRNARVFMEVCQRLLADDGLFLLHWIGGNRDAHGTEPWLGQHIFPNSMLLSLKQAQHAASGLFVTEDVHNFGPDYEPTLLAWHANFVAAWELIRKTNSSFYTNRFYRMWVYYLLSCAGVFRARHAQLYQVVFSKNRHGTYRPVRP